MRELTEPEREPESSAAWRPVPGTVAVMQPYFFPYAGYFRLLAAAETFVILDDVQFPRRGRVHRCQCPGPGGSLEWLTLPLARQPRETPINRLRFAPNARELFDRRLARLRWLGEARGDLADAIRRHLQSPLDDVPGFLDAGLNLVRKAMHLPARLTRSSAFALDPALRGQERIIALAKALDARVYVNAPGGRPLYRPEAFRRAGLELKFLVAYQGAKESMLFRLLAEEPGLLREDILRNTRVTD